MLKWLKQAINISSWLKFQNKAIAILLYSIAGYTET